MYTRNAQRAITTVVGLLVLLGTPLLRPAAVQALDAVDYDSCRVAWLLGTPLLRPAAVQALDAVEADDGFGVALLGEDFNGDGYADLAVGVPGKDFPNNIVNCGLVAMLYGSPAAWTKLTTEPGIKACRVRTMPANQEMCSGCRWPESEHQ
jgi:hypothetical protein